MLLETKSHLYGIKINTTNCRPLLEDDPKELFVYCRCAQAASMLFWKFLAKNIHDKARSMSKYLITKFFLVFKYMNISLRWSYKTTVKKDLTRTILLKRRRLKSYIVLCISKVLILYFSSFTNLCIIFLINASLCPQNSPNVPSIIMKIVKFQILSLDRRL